MLSESHLDRLQVVLVSPRNPLNIGAAARAMANFGFSHLAVVAPYEPHWREAKSAIGSEKLLQNAKSAEHLADAVADCTLVIGTASLTRRKPEQPVASLPDLPPIVQRELDRGGRIALVFGSEKRGLSREDLSHCHLLVTIPTDSRQPSMNLGQAVAVCLYELCARPNALRASGDVEPDPAQADPQTDDDPPASARDLEILTAVVEETMRAANYSPSIMRKANRHDMHLLLRRLTLSRRDARRILGLFRRILWQLQNRAGQSNK